MSSSADSPPSPSPVLRRVLAPGLIFALALALRLLYLEGLEADPLREEAWLPWRVWGIIDSAYYHKLALHFGEGTWLAPTAHFLSPIYCYTVAAVYAVCGADLEWVRISQAILGALSCVLLHGIGRRVFCESVGVLAGLALACYGLHIYYTGLILPAVLVLFLNLLFLYLLVGLPGKPTLPRALLVGLVLGLAVGAKPNALLLVPVAVAVLALQRGGLGPSRLAALAGALILGTALTVAPLTIHNWIVTDQFVLVSTNGGRNLLKGNGPTANGTHAWLPAEQSGISLSLYLDDEVDPREAVRESSEMSAAAWRFIAERPAEAAKLFAKKALLCFNRRELFIRDNYYFAQRSSRLLGLPLVGFGLVATLGLAGALWGWRRWRAELAIHGTLWAHVASYVLIFVLARYRLVLVSCLILFACSFALSMVGLVRRREGTKLLWATILVSACAVFVHLPFGEFPREHGFELMEERVDSRAAYRARQPETQRRQRAPARGSGGGG